MREIGEYRYKKHFLLGPYRIAFGYAVGNHATHFGEMQKTTVADLLGVDGEIIAISEDLGVTNFKVTMVLQMNPGSPRE